MISFDSNQVYMPAEDTFLLRDAALAEVHPADYVIEIGTGSGEIAAAVQKIAYHTIAVDINPHAVAYAKKINAVDAIRGDLFSAISGTFNLILFNPPYLPTEDRERIDDWLEYALDGGKDGMEVIRKFLPAALSHLSIHGCILLLVSSLTGLDSVKKLAENLGCSTKITKEETEEDGEILFVLRIFRP